MNRKIVLVVIAILILLIAYVIYQNKTNKEDNWAVEITSVSPDKNAKNYGTMTDPNYKTTGNIMESITDGLTADITVNLMNQQDTVTYVITVKNTGKIDALLKSINQTLSSNPNISFTVSGIKEGDILKAGTVKTFTVVAAYNNENINDKMASFNLTLNYVKK